MTSTYTVLEERDTETPDNTRSCTREDGHKYYGFYIVYNDLILLYTEYNILYRYIQYFQSSRIIPLPCTTNHHVSFNELVMNAVYGALKIVCEF